MNGVEVVIDEVVVHGMSAGDAAVMLAELTAALEVHATDPGTIAGRDEASRRAADVAGERDPATFGADVASAVWAAVQGGRR